MEGRKCLTWGQASTTERTGARAPPVPQISDRHYYIKNKTLYSWRTIPTAKKKRYGPRCLLECCHTRPVSTDNPKHHAGDSCALCGRVPNRCPAGRAGRAHRCRHVVQVLHQHPWHRRLPLRVQPRTAGQCFPARPSFTEPHLTCFYATCYTYCTKLPFAGQEHVCVLTFGDRNTIVLVLLRT